VCILLKDGFALKQAGPRNLVDATIYLEPYKYLTNFLQMPAVAALFLIGVVAVLWGIGKTLFTKAIYTKGIWFAGIGTVLTVLALLLNVGLNNTAYYPSLIDKYQSSLTIYNSSSSKFTLTAMSIVSLFIPFVLAYIVYMWRLINKKKLDLNDIQTESHIY
jgi:cytochrome d ubiquinol oxidase subunit II